MHTSIRSFVYQNKSSLIFLLVLLVAYAVSVLLPEWASSFFSLVPFFALSSSGSSDSSSSGSSQSGYYTQSSYGYSQGNYDSGPSYSQSSYSYGQSSYGGYSQSGYSDGSDAVNVISSRDYGDLGSVTNIYEGADGTLHGTVDCGSGCIGDIASGDTVDYNNYWSGQTGRDVWATSGQFDSGPNSSTPFLSVWNGHKYVNENDFLFGKPNTAFSDFTTGLSGYQEGIGGDTYLLTETLSPDKSGKLKMQVKELEPEESYIDSFSIKAVDLDPDETLVVDGNLTDSYIFNQKEANILSGQTVHHFHPPRGTFKAIVTANSLSEKTNDTVLARGDELIIKIPRASLSATKDNYILIESHYRDWTLGEQVPFSRLERFSIGSVALARTTMALASGVAIVAGASLFGMSANQAQADTPYAESGYTGQSGYSNQSGYSGNYGQSGYSSGGSCSLVVSIGDSNASHYLQTIFTRYVQASQEVVKIPANVIKNMRDEVVTIKVLATKKHKVSKALVFAADSKKPVYKELSLEKSLHNRTNLDYSQCLKEKNNNFLHTIPGDVVEISFKDVPKIEGKNRRYVLQSHGFYTKLSKATADKIGKNWLKKLLPEDRKLLKHLRLT